MALQISRHVVEYVYALDGGAGKEILTTGDLYLAMKDGKKVESKFATTCKVDEDV